MVAYLSMKEMRKDGDSTQKIEKRVFQVHPTPMIVAKTRIGGLKPEVSYEELKAVMTTWVGGKSIDNPVAVDSNSNGFDGVQVQD